eukprot:g238.t1
MSSGRGQTPASEPEAKGAATAGSGKKPRRTVSEITIAATETRHDGRGGTFTVYQIVVKTPQLRWAVYRRYSQLARLHGAMVTDGYGPALSALGASFPGKIWVGNMSASKVKRRAKDLAQYLQKLVKVEGILYNSDVVSFFGMNTSRDSAERIDHSITEFGWVHRTGGLKRATTSSARNGLDLSPQMSRSRDQQPSNCTII